MSSPRVLRIDDGQAAFHQHLWRNGRLRLQLGLPNRLPGEALNGIRVDLARSFLENLGQPMERAACRR